MNINQKLPDKIIFQYEIYSITLIQSMLARLSFHNKKSENKINEIFNAHQNSQHNEKENNQQNLNLIKKSLKFNELDPTLCLKAERKNCLSNIDNRLNLSLNYNSNQLVGQIRGKINSRIEIKQNSIKKQKYQSNTEQFYELYGKDIVAEYELVPIHKPDFLKNHQVDAGLRSRMLDWMVEVTKSYKFINKSYFASVELLDRFFIQSKQIVPVSQLHILGVISMYIASKMDEVYPLKIKTIYEKIVHKKISKETLMEMEKTMFDTLNHKVNSWTFFDLALLKIADQIGGENNEIRNKVEQIISFISKCILYEYDLYIRYDMETFAKVLVKIATKICNLPSKNEAYSVSCHEDIVKSFKKFKSNFKGLNNIFRFSDQKIVQIVDFYFFEEPKMKNL